MPCHSQDPINGSEFVHVHSIAIGDSRYRVAISAESYKDLPNWTLADAGYPPITPKTVIELAELAIGRLPLPPHFEGWELKELRLRPILPNRIDSKMMYLVVFRARDQQLEPIIPPEAILIVTLDGKLIEPISVKPGSPQLGRLIPYLGEHASTVDTSLDQ